VLQGAGQRLLSRRVGFICPQPFRKFAGNIPVLEQFEIFGEKFIAQLPKIDQRMFVETID
jgi:hypothetical protein